MATLGSITDDYAFFKKKARRLIRGKNYNLAIDAIKTAGTIAQTYCLGYSDLELEDMLAEIARSILPARGCNDLSDEHVDNGVVFFDSFGKDNVMLTVQYLDALISSNRRILYVTTRSLKSLECQKFYKSLLECKNAKVIACPAEMTECEKVQFLHRAITDFLPSVAFIHIKTEDISGLLPWYQLPDVRRYYVEVTDHSFWFGVKAIDYCICFRNYGYNVALKYRNLKKAQLFVLPFYSMVADYEFEGLPSSIDGSVKLFSGGRITKIYGENDAFLSMVRQILVSHPNTEFYFAGGGLMNGAARMGHVERFIRDNELQDRFHLLGQRKDILKLTEQMDIYINTYPFGGGLMVQLAAACGLPIVILALNGLCESIEEFLCVRDSETPGVTFYDEKSYYSYVDSLICDTSLRRERGQTVKKYVQSPSVFRANLWRLLEDNVSPVTVEEHDVDFEQRQRINIEVENTILHRYHGIMLRSKVLLLFRPFRYISEGICFAVKSDKKYLAETIASTLFGRRP